MNISASASAIEDGSIETTIDPTKEFRNGAAGPNNPETVSDGVVYTMAELAAAGHVSWSTIKSYGDEIYDRAQFHFGALTQG